MSMAEETRPGKPAEEPGQVASATPAASGAEGRGSRSLRWGKRVGTIGFLFFLVKGLLWLLIPALILAWQWVRSL